jgi:hypothetical protein
MSAYVTARTASALIPPRGYCTFAVTDALASRVNAQVLIFLLLEQAPDQMGRRVVLGTPLSSLG